MRSLTGHRYIWMIITLFIFIAIPSLKSVLAVEYDIPNAPEQEAFSKEYDEQQGVVIVQLLYVDSDNQSHTLKQGCGFFIGSEEEGRYILTNYHTVHLSDAEKQAALEEYAIENGRLNTRTQVILRQDLSIDVSYENGSEAMDVAIMKPGSSLGQITTLQLCEEPYYSVDAPVHSYGYQTQSPAGSDIIRSDGVIEDWMTETGVHYIQHSIAVNDFNTGAPLINEQGEVIGMNVLHTAETYAIQISEIIQLLDTLGIPYNEPIKIDLDILQDAMAAYEEQDFSGYSEESVAVCQSLYAQAEELEYSIESGEVTVYSQDEVNQLGSELAASIEQLEKPEWISRQALILVIMVAGVLVAAIVVLIIIMSSRRKKYQAYMQEQHQTPEQRLNMQGMVSVDDTLKVSGSYLPVNRTLGEIQGTQDTQKTYSETTVLNSSTISPIQERKILRQGSASLIRIKTGDIIPITKSSYVIGKSTEQADYGIQGNAGISRRHVCIKQTSDGYYIQDLKTTNGTYVDGSRVSWDKDVKLLDGSIIRMADEEFEFRIQ